MTRRSVRDVIGANKPSARRKLHPWVVGLSLVGVATATAAKEVSSLIERTAQEASWIAPLPHRSDAASTKRTTPTVGRAVPRSSSVMVTPIVEKAPETTTTATQKPSVVTNGAIDSPTTVRFVAPPAPSATIVWQKTAGTSRPVAQQQAARRQSPAVQSPAVQIPAVGSPAVGSPAVESPAVQQRPAAPPTTLKRTVKPTEPVRSVASSPESTQTAVPSPTAGPPSAVATPTTALAPVGATPPTIATVPATVPQVVPVSPASTSVTPVTVPRITSAETVTSAPGTLQTNNRLSPITPATTPDTVRDSDDDDDSSGGSNSGGSNSGHGRNSGSGSGSGGSGSSGSGSSGSGSGSGSGGDRDSG
jgi:hypothetical protein